MLNRSTFRRTLVSSTAAALLLAASAAQAPAQESRRGGVDLREGAVFTMSNARSGNAVVAMGRRADGRLVRVGSFPTGGTGSESFEDTANSMVVGSAEGEAGPNNLIDEAELLFVTNARSNSITVFRIGRGGLQRVGVTPSGGEKPVSLTVSRGVLYVLHSGEATDDLFDSEMQVIPNCTTGTPSVTGFRVSRGGELTPIPDSTRRLSGMGGSGCAQVSFSPDGRVLVATERLAGEDGPPGHMGDEGQILTFVRNDDGTLREPVITPATGSGPFGFTFSQRGELYVTEQFDGPMGPGLGAAASYRLDRGGRLTPTSRSTPNGGTDTCWFVVTDDGRWGFATSFFGGGRISVYNLEGGMRVVNADAAPQVMDGAADLTLSRDSRYLYMLNAMDGKIYSFRIGENGSLAFIGSVEGAGRSRQAGRLGLAGY